MSKWNYRVMVKEFPNGILECNIYEVYYDDDGVPNGCTMNAVTPGGFDMKLGGFDDLISTLDWMKLATEKPILWYGDKFPQVYNKDE